MEVLKFFKQYKHSSLREVEKRLNAIRRISWPNADEKIRVGSLFKDITPYLHKEMKICRYYTVWQVHEDGQYTTYSDGDGIVTVKNFSRLILANRWAGCEYGRFFDAAMDLIDQGGKDWKDKRYLEFGAGCTYGAHPSVNCQALAPSQPLLARILAAEGVDITAVDPNLDPEVEEREFGLRAIKNTLQALEKQIGTFDVVYGINLPDGARRDCRRDIEKKDFLRENGYIRFT